MNYNYLVVYVNLFVALILAFDKEHFVEQISRFSKYAIGFIFMIAAIQKILSAEFITGAYFINSFCSNPVFATFIECLGFDFGGVEYLEHWNALFHGFTSETTEFEVLLPNHPGLQIMAKIMAVMSIALEAAIALAFLLPNRFKFTKYKDIFLLIFLFGAYFIVPMIGYGILFAAMGYTLHSENRKMATIYLAAAILVSVIFVFRSLQIKALFQILTAIF